MINQYFVESNPSVTVIYDYVDLLCSIWLHYGQLFNGYLKMNLFLFLTYMVTSLSIIATPGPSTMLMVQQAIKYGRSVVIFNSLGSALASLILISISAFGLTSFFSHNVLIIMSFVGSLYLMYIGAKEFFNSSEKVISQESLEETGRKDLLKCFYHSFVTGISNPKDIMFFLLFLPQFIDKNSTGITSQIFLIFGWIFLDITIVSTYGILANSIRGMGEKKLINIKRFIGFVIFLIGAFLLLNLIRETL